MNSSLQQNSAYGFPFDCSTTVFSIPLMKTKYVTVNAAHQTLGRVASGVAKGLLVLSKSWHFTTNRIVLVQNINEVQFNGCKLTTTAVYKHSGVPGHLKQTTWAVLLKKDVLAVLRKVVYGMLPNNKWRANLVLRIQPAA